MYYLCYSKHEMNSGISAKVIHLRSIDRWNSNGLVGKYPPLPMMHCAYNPRCISCACLAINKNFVLCDSLLHTVHVAIKENQKKYMSVTNTCPIPKPSCLVDFFAKNRSTSSIFAPFFHGEGQLGPTQ